jgi:formate-dependent nitrite reductase membrane component NrfD
VWGWKVAAYLFVAGAGAGAYAVGAAASRLGPAWTPAATAGLAMGPLLVGPATLFLIADLGRPGGFLRAGRRPASSWISRGVVILSAFLLLSLVHAALAVLAPGRLAGSAGIWLALLGGALAGLVMVYTGLLLGAVRPIPFWSTPVLPLLFLVSSCSTGIMALDLALGAAGQHGPEAAFTLGLRRADLGLLALEGMVVALYLALAHGTVAARASARLLLAGELAPRFWGGVVGAGLVLPFALELVAVLTRPADPSLPAAAALGLLGGFLLRLLVIEAGVKMPLVAAGMLFSLPGQEAIGRR